MDINERNTYIFKEIKNHLNYIKKIKPNIEIAYIALQGSQNYNLDIYNDEYKSDIDTKAIVIPSLEDISKNKKPISETIILPDNSHCDLKDIRIMFEQFKKQNINFVEIIFTKYRIINPRYKDLFKELYDNRERIAHFNTNQAIRCIAGMSMQKLKALEHPYEGLKDKIEKYGYDGKQLHHIIRMNNFIKTYAIEKKPFEYCLTYNPNIDMLYKAKLNKYSLEEAREIANKCNKETIKLEKENLLEKDVIDNNVIDLLQNIQYESIKRYIQYEITPKINIVNKEYDNVFVTSDLHFGHINVMMFEPQRYDELIGISQEEAVSKYIKEHNININEVDIRELYREVNKQYIDQHDNKLIKNWNDIVKENDLVYILGDLSFKNGEETNKILQQLNGDKILIKGNHDFAFLDTHKFDKSLFKEIVDYKEINIYDKNFVLFHYPIATWNLKQKGSIHLYGHVHSNKTTTHPLEMELENAYNVGVDVNHYKPINIKNFIKE